MNLSISNIAWNAEQNENIYTLMQKYNFSGLEIAPTKIFERKPYSKLSEVKIWSEKLKARYSFVIPSMQSIWFGKPEKLFGSRDEREILLDYTKKAIDFASIIGCKNLVFGCPKNRAKTENFSMEIAIDFFKKIGDYAASKNTCIGIEANPTIYGTDFINTTAEAIDLICQIGSDGLKLNLDVGAIISNKENLSVLMRHENLINHVHISEPNLVPIEKRELHKEIFDFLKKANYVGFVSIEMASAEDAGVIERAMKYLESICF